MLASTLSRPEPSSSSSSSPGLSPPDCWLASRLPGFELRFPRPFLLTCSDRLALSVASLADRSTPPGSSGDCAGKKYDSFSEPLRMSPWPMVAPSGGCGAVNPDGPPSVGMWYRGGRPKWPTASNLLLRVCRERTDGAICTGAPGGCAGSRGATPAADCWLAEAPCLWVLLLVRWLPAGCRGGKCEAEPPAAFASGACAAAAGPAPP
mmetsp:Transcript_20130/g.63034  ORF Transcript_20130/g.63034 Transcript_20130/m.63034 type:complete len:207 (+) Transcript_20130:63-683(+)